MNKPVKCTDCTWLRKFDKPQPHDPAPQGCIESRERPAVRWCRLLAEGASVIRFALAFVLVLIVNACAHEDEGKRFENFIGDDRVAAWDCHGQGYGWFRLERYTLICYAHARPDAFSVAAVIAEERAEDSPKPSGGRP